MRVRGIGQNCYKSGKDWSEFLQKLPELLREWVRLVRISMGWAGLDRIPAGVGRINQKSYGIGQDWAEFVQEKAG